MSQPSEERLIESAEAPQESARILPFERPPSELQKAVQLRAQEALDRDRERAKTKPAPLRWAIMFVLALIPVLLLVAGIDAFVRVFHHINDVYSKMPVPAAQEPSATEQPQTQPGVVMLQTVPEDAAPTVDEKDKATQ